MVWGGVSATIILRIPPCSISLVEPGPVTTEFEAKVYEEAERADYSQTDPETAAIFTDLYLRNSRDVFASLGQSPEDIAEVMAELQGGMGGYKRAQLALMRSSNWAALASPALTPSSCSLKSPKVGWGWGWVGMGMW